MNKRIAIILVPSLLFTGVLTTLFFSQFNHRLPAEAQDILDSYLEAIPGEVTVTGVSYARDYDQFTADMARPIIHAPIREYRSSPIFKDSEIVRPLEETSQFPLPAQELWCVTLVQDNKPADFYFLARHDNLYGATWVLYQSQNGVEPTKTAGCAPVLPVD
jgi:hypothetical protein